MKKLTVRDLTAALVWLLPVIYLVAIYPSLPARVPLHFGMDGKPNRYGSQQEFFLVQLVMSGISAGVYILFKYLPSIDPKKTVQYSEATLNKIGLGVVSFVTIINLLVIYAVTHNGLMIEKPLFFAMGIFFAFLGNMMNNLKPNYFVGIRTPWTLESPDTWKATHRLAAKMWFVGGCFITLLSLLLPSSIVPAFFMGCVIIIAFVPVVYSYIYFKKHKQA